MNAVLPAPAATASRTAAPKRARRSLWDRFSIYLPILMMGLLALGTYWLLEATPSAVEEKEAPPVTSEPDFFMRRFSVKVFDERGRIKSEVYGTEARHHPDTDSTVVDNAKTRSYNLQRQLSTAEARTITTNSDNTVFVLEGDAVLVRQASKTPEGKPIPRLEFHGQYLRVTTKPETVMSDQPVRIVRGPDEILSNTLNYDGELDVVVLDGRVRAQLAPRPPSKKP